ncbi:NUDIX domain-containing protein [Haloferax mediterranei ATCC 33500]|uniref:DNA mismatch repair protein MutT n=2 Tax=Haloferacaceae TaxID=1644056 RepID=I3R1V5_HALMT|nr:mutT/NUDIX family protein [Haloferax mediterranei ATCC 33500]AHZ22382.1 DNA mismatch repair protein MutT [Haloferax mediterranei ATCC 33500]EMA02512.1 mutT/NUDIX family protein [Haloferax mediterranei ATCC 33500]QCQ74739.1 NUDIX domain-containing protein [Haloferax mediterranei ATCC 33500]
MSPRIAARGLLVRDGELLVIRYRTDGEDWYAAPGGGQKRGESLAETVRREVYEETGYEVAVGSLAFVRDFVPSTHYEDRSDDGHQVEHFFWCEQMTDEPDDPTERDSVQVGVTWLPLDSLGDVRFFPGPLGDLLRDGVREGTNDARGACYLGDVD